MRCFTAVLFGVLLVSFPSSRDRATAAAPTGNVQLCNDFPHTVFFALGWSENRMAYSRGWWTVPTNRCINARVPANTFFWHAVSVKYQVANGDTDYTTWNGKAHQFCTSTNDFYFDHADGPCGKNARSGFNASFTRTDGIPVYETVTIGESGSSSQSISAGHTQELTAP
jgi:uncharacterized membrane protein